MSKKRKEIQWQQYIGIAFFGIIGAICGILAMETFDAVSGKDFGEFMFYFAFIIIIMCVVLFLQIVIHEAGHLIFGLMTGYKFSSFRVGSFVWMKENGKLRLRKLYLAGTAGQCIMVPPEMVDGKIPFVLYNLGGPLVNVISGIIFLVLYQIYNTIPFLSAFLLINAVVGFAYALMNGIPMRVGMVDNDGYNALSLGKNREALRSFWIQMKANEQMTRGVGLRDMPEEWFTIPSQEGMKNSMTAVMGVFACNRHMDVHAFDEADYLMEKILRMDSAMVGLHRNLLVCDRIYCELIRDNRKDKLEKMLDKQQMKFMKAMKQFPSVLRTQYVYALLSEKDEEKALKIKEQFEKVAKTYPYSSDLESERELIDIAENAKRKMNF